MKQLSDAEKWKILVESDATKADPKACETITAELGASYMVNVVSELASPAAAELLRSLPKDFREQVLLGLDPQKAIDLKEILSYPLGTSGAIMGKEFLFVPGSSTIAQAVSYLQKLPAEKKRKSSYIYAVDNNKTPIGVVSLRDLIFYPGEKIISDVMAKPVVYIHAAAPQAQAVQLFEKHRYYSLPVVDERKRLTGVVTIDNAISVVRKQAANEIAKMVGSEAAEGETSSVIKILGMRIPWLMISIASGLFCAFITSFFEHHIEAAVTLFLFIPVILGLSESTAVQGATIVVQNLSRGENALKNFGSLFAREVGVGFLIAIICASIVGVVASFWKGSPMVGVALAAAMMLTITISAFIGLLLPLVFRTFKIDPALASGPLVLAVCDIQTLFVYFSLSGKILANT